jgi:hypothetical protein
VTSVTKTLTDYRNPKSVGSRLRARRLAHLKPMMETVFREKGAVRILDMGGTTTYWRLLSADYVASRHVEITLLNLPGEIHDEAAPPFRIIEGDGCDLSMIEDNAFDLVHSNSVLEHVGDWNRMKAFAHEVRRLAPKYFVQTPNFWFPIEPHFMCPFFHWLPEPARVRLLLLTGLGHYPRAESVDVAVASVQGARLLSRRMMADLFPDAGIVTERVALLPKSLMAIRSNAEGGTLSD